jgi:hypothetical protein
VNEHLSLLQDSHPHRHLYPIYVPSYDRAGTAPLLNMLADSPKEIQKLVHIVVRASQLKVYKLVYPWATVIVQQGKGIGPARMACMTHADIMTYERIVVLDDDIIHVSLLEKITHYDQKNQVMRDHTRRYSAKVSGIPEPELLYRSLSAACRMADRVFKLKPHALYGAARNALFSGDVDTEVGATLNKGSFPACVMFIHLERFRMREMPEAYRYHGEDLAMFLYALEDDGLTFTLPGVAYDQHGNIKTTIPLNPLDPIGRPHLQTTVRDFPRTHPYLRVSMRNPLGGVMRIGVNWNRWYKATSSVPIEIPLSKIMKGIN